MFSNIEHSILSANGASVLTNRRDDHCSAVCRRNTKKKNPNLGAGNPPLSYVCYVSETIHNIYFEYFNLSFFV